MLVVVGAAMVVPFGVALAAAAPGDTIGAFNAASNAPGLMMIYDNAGGAGGSHPVGYGTVPEASASAEPGFGRGLASVVWPGPLLGNLGTAAPLLPGVGQLPPEVTGPLLPLLHDNANDPVKAEAQSGVTPDASYGSADGPAYMVAHADEKKVTGHAVTRGFDSGGAGFVGTIVSDGVTNVSDTAVSARASSVASNIAFAAGLVTIDSVTATATATTDGTKSSGTSSITMSGLKVQGTPATVDQDGLHIGTASAPITGPINDGAAQLAQSGLKITLVKPQEVKDGAAESIQSGSLVISFQPPGDTNGDSFVMTFGGAIAQVNANLGSPDAGLADVSTDTGVTPDASVPVAAPDSGASGPVADSVTSPPPLKPLKPVGAARSIAVSTAPIDFGHGVGPGLVLLGVGGAAIAAFGLKRLSTNVLAETPAATACPLEGRRP